MVSALAAHVHPCQLNRMIGSPRYVRDGAGRMFRAQIENLYVEAMVLADEAYGCFSAGRELGGAIDQATQRVALACESLKTTTRLMHVIAWLLHQRAMLAGEAGAGDKDSAARLGDALPADPALCASFDPMVQRIIGDSERLFDRVKRLDCQWSADDETAGAPVQHLLGQLHDRMAGISRAPSFAAID
jgi:regulator of CtrA degradation